MNRTRRQSEQGYVLFAVIFLLLLGAVITGGMATSTSSFLKTRSLTDQRNDRFYAVEETLNKTVNWLQSNSKNIVSAFSASNFATNFTLGEPSLGTNEGSHFSTPTMVKIRNSTQTVMLSNNSFFGVSAFPSTTHIDTGASFNAISSFQSADLGRANARIVLIWARSTNGNYEPVFRIDAVTGNNPDRGVHSYTYAYSTVVASGGGLGFYGENALTLNTPNNDCYSHEWSNAGGAWASGAQRANCRISSRGPIQISSKVFGTANSTQDPGVSLMPPGGNVSGGICEGSSCTTSSLPSVTDWASYCPSHNGDLTVSANTTLSAGGGCWRDITINNNRVLTISGTTAPYYIRTLNFQGAQGNIAFGNIPAGQKVRIFVEVPNSNYTLNGNRLINTTNAPHQVEITYIGTNGFTLNGTSQIRANIIAPRAPVTVSGNFNYYGGIQAQSLLINGNARLYYDEALGTTPVLSDLHFAMRKTSQRYR